MFKSARCAMAVMLYGACATVAARAPDNVAKSVDVASCGQLPAMQTEKNGGHVTFAFTLGPKGTVRDYFVINASGGKPLASAVAKLIRSCRFAPAVVNGDYSGMFTSMIRIEPANASPAAPAAPVVAILDTEDFYTDEITGCKLVMPKPAGGAERPVYRWSSGCKDGFVEGKGRLTSTQNGVFTLYEGAIAKGRRTGSATFTSPELNYVGQYADGYPVITEAGTIVFKKGDLASNAEGVFFGFFDRSLSPVQGKIAWGSTSFDGAFEHGQPSFGLLANGDGDVWRVAYGPLGFKGQPSHSSRVKKRGVPYSDEDEKNESRRVYAAEAAARQAAEQQAAAQAAQAEAQRASARASSDATAEVLRGLLAVGRQHLQNKTDQAASRAENDRIAEAARAQNEQRRAQQAIYDRQQLAAQQLKDESARLAQRQAAITAADLERQKKERELAEREAVARAREADIKRQQQQQLAQRQQEEQNATRLKQVELARENERLAAEKKAAEQKRAAAVAARAADESKFRGYEPVGGRTGLNTLNLGNGVAVEMSTSYDAPVSGRCADGIQVFNESGRDVKVTARFRWLQKYNCQQGMCSYRNAYDTFELYVHSPDARKKSFNSDVIGDIRTQSVGALTCSTTVLESASATHL